MSIRHELITMGDAGEAGQCQVGILTLDRPRRAHAYNREHLEGIRSAFRSLTRDVSIVVICSTGDRAFCGGADLGEMEQAAPLDALDLLSQRVFTEIARSAAVSICAVQGPAVAGGCELALACDLRVVGPGALFRLPETSLGIIPSAGGCTRLTRLVGASVSKQVILAGMSIDARRAVEIGLAMGVEEDAYAGALALAQKVGARDSVANRYAKQVIDRGEDEGSLEAERAYEALLYARKAGQ